MTEKKKKKKYRTFRTTDEEWKIIQNAAKERHQTPNEFLLSRALGEGGDEQEYMNQTAINTARWVYLIAADVVAKNEKEWVKKTIKKAAETYPVFGDEEDHGEGDE